MDGIQDSVFISDCFFLLSFRHGSPYLWPYCRRTIANPIRSSRFYNAAAPYRSVFWEIRKLLKTCFSVIEKRMPGICSNYGLVFFGKISWRAVATKIHSCAIPKTRNLTHHQIVINFSRFSCRSGSPIRRATRQPPQQTTPVWGCAFLMPCLSSPRCAHVLCGAR